MPENPFSDYQIAELTAGIIQSLIDSLSLASRSALSSSQLLESGAGAFGGLARPNFARSGTAGRHFFM